MSAVEGVAAGPVLLSIALAALLFGLASGEVLIFRARGIISFAHTGFALVGAHAISLIAGFAPSPASFWWGVPLAAIYAGLLGVGLDIGFIAPMRHRGPLAAALATFGGLLVFICLASWLVGSAPSPVPVPSVLGGSLEIAGEHIATYPAVAAAATIAIAIAGARWAGRRRSHPSLGVGIASGLAGLVGALWMPIFPATAQTALSWLSASMAVLLIGGFGSLGGALVAALLVGSIIGVAQAWHQPAIAATGPLLLALAVLICRQVGAPRQAPSAANPGAAVRRGPLPEQFAGAAVAAGGGLVAYFFVPPATYGYYLSLGTVAAIAGIFATSVGLLLRATGLASFGHAAFLAMGAFAFAVLINTHIVPADVAVMCALAVPTASGLLLGLAVRRLSALGFAMVTLVLGAAAGDMTSSLAVTGGAQGMVMALPDRLFGVPVSSLTRSDTLCLVMWGILALVLLLPIGHRSRPAALTISAFVAGLAGVMLALVLRFLFPGMTLMGVNGSAEGLAMGALGMPDAWMPAAAAALFTFAEPTAASLGEFAKLLLGLTIMAVALAMPIVRDGEEDAPPRGFWSLLSPQGRLVRSRFWVAQLGVVLAAVAVWRISAIASLRAFGLILLLVVMGPILCIQLATAVRRLHDRGKSGSWALLFCLVPAAIYLAVNAAGDAPPAVLLTMVALVVWGLVELGVLPGTGGTNLYGHDPRLGRIEVQRSH